MCMQAFQGEYGVEMRHMWGMTELSPIGSCAGFKVGPLLSHAPSHALPCVSSLNTRDLCHPSIQQMEVKRACRCLGASDQVAP